MVSLGRAVFWWETARFLLPLLLEKECPLQGVLRQFLWANGTLTAEYSLGQNVFSCDLEPGASHLRHRVGVDMHRSDFCDSRGDLRAHGLFAGQAV